MNSVRQRLYEIARSAAIDAWDDASEAEKVPSAVVDAVLPQITNPEQLANLTKGSIVVGRSGNGFVRKSSRTTPWESVTGGGYGSSTGDLAEISHRMFLHEGPLTLVWNPRHVDEPALVWNPPFKKEMP